MSIRLRKPNGAITCKRPTPHRARNFSDQTHVAEFAQGIGARFVGRFAACDAVADGFVEMAADFGVEFVFALLASEPVEVPIACSSSVEIGGWQFQVVATRDGAR